MNKRGSGYKRQKVGSGLINKRGDDKGLSMDMTGAELYVDKTSVSSTPLLRATYTP
jgi:hypothetical protein